MKKKKSSFQDLLEGLGYNYC